MSADDTIQDRLFDTSSGDPRPLHERLKQHLRWQILSGQIKERVEGEVELAARLGISRGPIQQAIGALVNEGLLTRKRGRGTFVNQDRVEKYYLEISSFTGTMKAQGLSPAVRILAFYRDSPSPELAAALKLDPGDDVFVYKRTVSLEGVPVVMTISTIPTKRVPDLDVSEADTSLYTILRARYGSTPIRVSDVYEAAGADADDADALAIAAGTPLLQVTRLAHDQTGDPIEHAVSRFVFGKLTVDISPLSHFLDEQFQSGHMSQSLWHHQVGHQYVIPKPAKRRR
jgi:GntR family transcriptional regulator